MRGWEADMQATSELVEKLQVKVELGEKKYREL
jgi:hypothetical protein